MGDPANAYVDGDRIRARVAMTEPPLYCGEQEAWRLIELKWTGA